MPAPPRAQPHRPSAEPVLRAHPEHRGERAYRGLDLVVEERQLWDAPAFAKADGMSATANTSERSADLMLWPVYQRRDVPALPVTIWVFPGGTIDGSVSNSDCSLKQTHWPRRRGSSGAAMNTTKWSKRPQETALPRVVQREEYRLSCGTRGIDGVTLQKLFREREYLSNLASGGLRLARDFSR
jgi:hypothetical protein